jgi:hypothetical protein
MLRGLRQGRYQHPLALLGGSHASKRRGQLVNPEVLPEAARSRGRRGSQPAHLDDHELLEKLLRREVR